MKITYPLELTMSQVRDRFELEHGQTPVTVIRTDEGWMVTDEDELPEWDDEGNENGET